MARGQKKCTKCVTCIEWAVLICSACIQLHDLWLLRQFCAAEAGKMLARVRGRVAAGGEGQCERAQPPLLLLLLLLLLLTATHAPTHTLILHLVVVSIAHTLLLHFF